jgi:LysM repeat protein
MMRNRLLIFVLLTLCAGTAQAQQPNVKSSEIVRVEGADYYLHAVAKGETLSSLSRLYDIPIERIEASNPVLAEGLKAGQTIKIECRNLPALDMTPRKIARTFDEHTVKTGQTAYSIAREYSISINVLVQDNPGLDPSRLSLGQVLMIRRSEVGETSPQEILAGIDDYAETLTAVSDGYIYYVPDIGETVYSISRKLGVAESDITGNNDLSKGLRAGAMLKIPASESALQAMRHGDKATEDLPDVSDTKIDYSVYSNTAGTTEFIPSYDHTQPLDVAMLLPLSSSGGSNFVEFYQGALLALEELKGTGYSINMNLYDTQRSPQTMAEIVGDASFRNADLIIGPVYEAGLPSVMEFARDRGVPVVSPLSAIRREYGQLLYQLTPSAEAKYNKLKEMLTLDKNIVFITTEQNDAEFERDMQQVAGEIPYQRVVYKKGMSRDFFSSLLKNARQENVFVVLSADEKGVEEVLTAISSVRNNRLARSISTGKISVIGNSKWMRYANLDRNLLFKLNASFVANYHADRGNVAVAAFDRRYITAFKELPSLFSYRGYDAVMLFAGAMLSGRGDLGTRLAAVATPLQSGYHFQYTPGGNTTNTEWALVTYGNDYTITVQ